jgi:hypothetical protein
MKSILIADSRTELLETLEPILKHWGYRVLSTDKARQVTTFLDESEPCMLAIGEGFLCDEKLGISARALKKIERGELAVVSMKDDCSGRLSLEPHASLDVPLELFELFSFIQEQVEQHPRRNLRLKLRLPGMYSQAEDADYILAEVLSLSIQGLFFRASSRIGRGDSVNVVFPLFGRCKEVEVSGTVLYTIQPDANNNFFQGFGICFDDLSAEQREHLHDFIREHFLREVAASNDGVGSFDGAQLRA